MAGKQTKHYYSFESDGFASGSGRNLRTQILDHLGGTKKRRRVLLLPFHSERVDRRDETRSDGAFRRGGMDGLVVSWGSV